MTEKERSYLASALGQINVSWLPVSRAGGLRGELTFIVYQRAAKHVEKSAFPRVGQQARHFTPNSNPISEPAGLSLARLFD